jgi:hypothetical protein
MALRLLCKIKKSQHIKSTILVYKPVGDYYSNYNDECFVKLLEILFISEICLKKRASYDFLSREQAKSECVCGGDVVRDFFCQPIKLFLSLFARKNRRVENRLNLFACTVSWVCREGGSLLLNLQSYEARVDPRLSYQTGFKNRRNTARKTIFIKLVKMQSLEFC